VSVARFTGSIARLLRRYGPFPEALVRVYTRQIVQGLHYLHTHGIVHRGAPPLWPAAFAVWLMRFISLYVRWADVKGGNVLVDQHGVVKLADFGTAKRVEGACRAPLRLSSHAQLR
jgi:serine/threonine protein kinase